MDNPIGMTEGAGGSARTEGLGPARCRQQGVLGGRRVSATAHQPRLAAVAPASTHRGPPRQSEWVSVYRQLTESISYLIERGAKAAAEDFSAALTRIDSSADYRYKMLGSTVRDVSLKGRNVRKLVRHYLAVEARCHRAEPSGAVTEGGKSQRLLQSLGRQTRVVLENLISKYGSVDARVIQPCRLETFPAGGAVTQPVSKPAAAAGATSPPIPLPRGTTVPVDSYFDPVDSYFDPVDSYFDPVDSYFGPVDKTQNDGSWVDEFIALERVLNQKEPPAD